MHKMIVLTDSGWSAFMSFASGGKALKGKSLGQDLGIYPEQIDREELKEHKIKRIGKGFRSIISKIRGDGE